MEPKTNNAKHKRKNKPTKDKPKTAKPNQQTHKAKNILKCRVQFLRFCQLQEWSQKRNKAKHKRKKQAKTQ